MALPVLTILVYTYAAPYRQLAREPNGWYTYWLLPPKQSQLTQPCLSTPPSIFYDWVKQAPPGSLLLVEAPRSCEFGGNRFPHYQLMHHQHTGIGLIDGIAAFPVRWELPRKSTKLAFKNFYHLSDPGQLAQRGVSCVILHKQICNEMPPLFPMENFGELEQCHQILKESFGVPVHEDEWISVYGVAPEFAALLGKWRLAASRNLQRHTTKARTT